MAVRVTPQAPQAPQGAAKGGDHLPAALVHTLEAAGLLKGGASPQMAAKTLLGALSAQGFGGGAGALAAQLQAALASFQRANGLPVTGRLDNATLTLLQNLGMIPKDVRTALGVLGVKDGFEGAALQKADAQPGAAQASASEAKTIQAFLSGMVKAALEGSQKAMEFLGNLFGGAGPGGAGAEGAAPQPAARDGQGAALAGKGADAPGRGDGTGLQRDVPGFAAKTSSAEQSRTSGAARKKPTERGLDEEGDPDDEEGRGAGEHGTSEGDGQGGAGEGAHDKGGEDGDPAGTERHTGNATSGDDDLWREERGHAVDDDGSDAEAGHYRVAALSVQVERALSRVIRDEEAANRATTYTWDVHLYRPGVYAPGQKPEELLHLAVKGATAFDRAWVKAAEALARLLEVHEPEARRPTSDDVLAAIRRARSR